MAKKILIVDDDPVFREAVGFLLEANGMSMIFAENGKKGFDLASKEKPDLIILDVMMGHQTEGYEVARQLSIHAGTKNIPVILVTGVMSESKIKFPLIPDGVWLPVKAVLEKPVKPQLLLKTIKDNIG